MSTDQTPFTVTENHIRLLGEVYWDWCDDAYEGAVAQNLKRPYGNSDVLGDVYQAVYATPWKEDELSDSLHDRMLKLHREMATVVQILTLSAAHGFPFKAGLTYRKTEAFSDLSWRPWTPPATYTDELDELAAEIYNVRAQSPQEMTAERWNRIKENFPQSARSCREAAELLQDEEEWDA